MQILYRKEKEIIETAANSGLDEDIANLLKTCQEVTSLANTLNGMKHYGKDFAAQVNGIQNARMQHSYFREKPMVYEAPYKKKNNGRRRSEQNQRPKTLYERGFGLLKNLEKLNMFSVE
jgi:hypothetical protein